MKTYINPQPHAVERVNKMKNQKKPTIQNENKIENTGPEQSDKEIFEKNAEEQAWEKSLYKHKHQ
ncbi:Uncharacterised protein [Legionella wadsworthii]|uniref:Uncharacterized protein n=1 Tax=Legionella wadsworthii TaxID=28088 RepID=A0A378LUU9_9GAMM|nr:hypothetical protein [Legionella wadsworthii]STY31120.1 Uncharacterised protein [Legionella wadsworthii]